MPDYPLAIKVKEKTTPVSLPEIGLKTDLYPFQKQGVLYLCAAEKCILADSTGLGKTAQCLGAILMWDRFESTGDEKWVIVGVPGSLYQWVEEFKKFTNLIPVISNDDPHERVANYMGRMWRFLLISYQTLLRDWNLLAGVGVKNWIFDDAHFFRHHNTKTARTIKRLTDGAKRVILATATPMQKNLMDMHSLLETLGLTNVFGSERGFKNNYLVTRRMPLRLRSGRTIQKEIIISHRNVEDFKKRIKPYIIKRTFQTVGEQLPKLMVRPVWLGMHEEQKQIYQQHRAGLIRAYDEGEHRVLQNKGFHSMMQILAGTRTVGLTQDVSMKLDTVVDFVLNQTETHEKVVVYSFYKETVRVLKERLVAAGIENIVSITGDDAVGEKEAAKKKFTEDPECKVLIGTGAIEQALNLQVARYLVMIDLISNPQRIVQLVGRIRRLGSVYDNIILYVLLTKGTIEEHLWRRLNYEAAISDAVFGEKSEVFASLSDLELIALIRK